MSKWKISIVLRRFKKVFSERASRNIEALQWKHIRKKSRPADGNCRHFLLSPIKVTVTAVVIRFFYRSYYLLHLVNCIFSWTFKSNLGKMILEKYQNLPFFNYTSILSSPLAKIWSASGTSHIQFWWELADLTHLLTLFIPIYPVNRILLVRSRCCGAMRCCSRKGETSERGCWREILNSNGYSSGCTLGGSLHTNQWPSRTCLGKWNITSK